MSFPVPPGAGALVGLTGANESWKDRLKQAAYNSPSGIRIAFAYETVSREIPLRKTAFEFPGINDAYIQGNGYGARRYPLSCFFSGKDHDKQATQFEAALLEDGIGKLEHPFYGTFNVTPFGDIVRRDDLKSAANQSVIDVTFWTTTGAVYPSSSANAQSEIQAALDAFDLSLATQFSNSTNLKGALNAANAIATIKKLLKTVSSTMKKVSDATSAVSRDFRAAQELVNSGMDVLIGQPLLLALQISNLIKEPGRALAGLSDRLDGYEQLANSIFGSAAGNPEAALTAGVALAIRTQKVANDFHIANLFALNAVSGSIVAAQNTTFGTRKDALNAAGAILDQQAAATAWADGGFAALGPITGLGTAQVDTGEGYQALQQAAALTAGFLIQKSASLLPERAIVLDRPRTLLDVAAQLYKSVDDDVLNFLIDTNDLTTAEILELPRLRKIVYYAAAA